MWERWKHETRGSATEAALESHCDPRINCSLFMLDCEIRLWDNENNTEKLHSSESESYTCYILMYSQYIVSFTDTSVHFTVTCSVNILYTWIGFVHCAQIGFGFQIQSKGNFANYPLTVLSKTA